MTVDSMMNTLPLIPFPSKTALRLEGSYVLPETLVFSFESQCFPKYKNFIVQYIEHVLGREILVLSKTPTVTIMRNPTVASEEGYTLKVQPEGCCISCSSEKGLFYAVQSFCQLVLASQGLLNCCFIEDEPALSWRGLMVDVARSFSSIEELYSLVDTMALYKLNVFHLHLSDDQGWRLPIDGFPELVGIQGKYYTHTQLRELVAYARERQITIVPEIDLPGHVLSALSMYPQLSCTGGPFSIASGEGIFSDILCVGKNVSLDFAKAVIDQLCDIFTSPWVHLGGDEIPLERWKECPDCQKRKQQLGLENEKDLLRWFCNEMISYAKTKEKKVIFWSDYIDEAYDSSLIKQVWNPLLSNGSGKTDGHMTIQSDYFHTYLDMDYNLVPLSVVYRYGRLLQNKHAFFSHVMGSELLLWTEYLDTKEKREQHLFPRLLAGSEAFWTNGEQHDYRRFKRIVAKIFSRDKLQGRPNKWDPPILTRMVERRKRWKRIKKNSKEAGIVLD